jgi:hypothetical protein
MNHRPFEDWLLSGEPLSAAQKHDLHDHLSGCDYCSALVEVNTALRTTRPAIAAPGFVTRFEARLQAQHALQRRRAFWGVFFLALASAGLILFLGLRLLPYFRISPLELLVSGVPYLVLLLNSVHALGEIGSVLIRMAASFVPGYVWVMAALFCAFFGWLWVVSISRFAKLPQGA